MSKLLVDVDQNPRIGCLVRTREADTCRVGRAASRDGELVTGDVELIPFSQVQTTLYTREILT